MTLQEGTELYNRYVIEGVLAQGGMGAIYRGLDKNLGVRVAVKENLYSTRESVRQFQREATILAGLRHPNLPRVTDHFVIPDQGQYLVMDFIEGEDLKDRILEQGHLSEEESVKIGIGICNAVSYLHKQAAPIYHRDIKPSNIKINASGQVYLVDFGLAHIEESAPAYTAPSNALTPGYAPPEQYNGKSDVRSDVYALGATLYAAMTGCTPEDALARKLGTNPLTPIQAHNNAISDATARVVERAMALAPSQRYQTADAFRKALLNANPKLAGQNHNHLKEEITLFVTESALDAAQVEGAASLESLEAGALPVPAARRISNNGWMFIGFGGILILLALFLLPRWGIFPVAATEATHTPTHNSATATPTLHATAESTQAPALIPSITASPTQTFTPEPTRVGGGTGKVLFVSDRTGLPQLWLLEPNNVRPIKITNLEDGACQPDWSPDGKQIVFISPCQVKLDIYKGTGLFIINADGSALRPLLSVPGGDFDPDWSPDGKQIAFTSLRDGLRHIYLYNLENNTVTRLSSPSSSDRRPAWSPDGHWIAFETTRQGVPQIWLMDRFGGSLREFSDYTKGAAASPNWSPNGEVIVFSQGVQRPWLVAKRFNVEKAPEVRVSETRPAWDAQYSHDGFWILFEHDKDGNLDIYRMTVSGTELTALTSVSSDDFDPKWFPLVPASTPVP